MKWWEGSGGGGAFDAFFCLSKDTVVRESLKEPHHRLLVCASAVLRLLLVPL
ncbi:hypothetical protein LguiB_023170 [Lonicera macranthoides]